MKRQLLLFLMFFVPMIAFAQINDGHNLWLNDYRLCPNSKVKNPSSLYISFAGQTSQIIKQEITTFVVKAYKSTISDASQIEDGSISVFAEYSKELLPYFSKQTLLAVGDQGFLIKHFGSKIIIAANSQAGALYGVYTWIRNQKLYPDKKDCTQIPSFQLRLLNHWDNLDASVERGYAGSSIWFENGMLNPRDKEIYARANASIGINGTVLNNVNANPKILESKMLKQIKDLAEFLAPYQIKVYLSINFSSPSALGGLETSDPLDKKVIAWWQDKVKEIYKLIPNFGGFLVKANSEGLPGPQDFNRTHADGANMLAKILKPYGGIVMWRAFVYQPTGSDRAGQAYDEFKPLDGEFDDNVIIQVKNGPVDFQPREPYSPLFGAMKYTSLMPELQITQEYLGFSTHLCYLGTLFKEFFNLPTLKDNKTVLETFDKNSNQKITAIAGVANTGRDANWCGHIFAQSNWYCFGRLAWSANTSAVDIAKDWIKETFTFDEEFVEEVSDMMIRSREAVVSYMTPFGLHHLMGWNNHYGPQPWCDIPGARLDWMPKFFHKADKVGIGFDRSREGSATINQYPKALADVYNDPRLCPEEYLLWFHHLPWNFLMRNQNTLWNNLCERYTLGAQTAEGFIDIWQRQQGKIDNYRFNQVAKKLQMQADEAWWWRDACILYFGEFSKMPMPKYLPEHKYKTISECEQKRLEGAHWK